jgi:phosphoglycolate phosphatase
MARLVVFDLDGTLVDSQRDLANAANALVQELGGNPLGEEEIATMVGEGAAVLVRRVLSAAGLDPVTPGALPRFLALYDDRLVEHTKPYAGIDEALDTIGATARMAVLTNKPQHATDRLLRALALSHYFQVTIGGDTAFGRKPAAAGLLRICELMHTAPEDTLMVGDSPVDLQTARNAGTQVLLVSYGFGFRFSPEELIGVPVVASSSQISGHVSARITIRSHSGEV